MSTLVAARDFGDLPVLADGLQEAVCGMRTCSTAAVSQVYMIWGVTSE